jgi:hypothetical protein
MNERKTSLLDKSTGRYAVSNQLNDKEPSLSIELRELKALSMADVARLV